MRRLVSFLVITIAVLMQAATAGAATQLGQLPPGDPDGPVFESANLAQAAIVNGTPYEVPAGGGVITSWQHVGDSTTPGAGRLQLWRPAGGVPAFDFTLIARSDVHPFVAGAVNSFPTRIPVSGGELVGLRIVQESLGGAFTSGFAGENLRFANNEPETVPGQTRTLSSGYGGRANVAVTLEPDADGDGFGDETQDLCPIEAATQAECEPPETTITSGPPDRTKKKFVRFEFASSEADSDFECSFDSEPFRPCLSPEDEKVRKGPHAFRVRATDPLGNADATPAADEWKLKRKKKR